MSNLMEEIFRLITIGILGAIISIFNILGKYADVLTGLCVGIVTIIFLLFQIVKIRKDIQLKNIELREKNKPKK